VTLSIFIENMNKVKRGGKRNYYINLYVKDGSVVEVINEKKPHTALKLTNK